MTPLYHSDTDALWETFKGKGDNVDDSTAQRFETVKCPKPDYAFYLPMYHLSDDSHLPEIVNHGARGWYKIPTPFVIKSFSWSNLKILYKNSLRPTPFRLFHKVPQEKDLKCYPWLLFEYKKENYTTYERLRLEETVCCQTANGSASAVKLNKIAARYTIELPDKAYIPPIPVITTVRLKVNLWITCLAKGCIATRVYKPLITTYIDQWRFVHSGSGLESITTTLALALARRQQAMNLLGSALPLI
ncbi:hypothetical protein LB504_006185 [Fusarium proliferatum]|nr:hypothetical protein LB504_006185 [Fusarium proliferatum]